jgi:class 3 adenylate cyclase
MRCPSCHHDNRTDRRFCTQCGTRLAVGCPSCGAPIEAGERFCGGCGAALTIGGRTTPSPARAPLLADKIRQAKATVEGERKQVTVLFVDVKGSMKLAEQLDPEAWSEIMQRFFRVFCDSIERFEGFVDKFTGDGGMVLFGAPIAHEDHAQRACYAALHLRDAVRTYGSEVRAQHGMPFAVRIGLNSGEVVVGRIGDDLRMEFTAQGHVVGPAQRMEGLAEPGHLCLSEHTARLVEGYFQLHDLGRITVKGVSGPVGHFDLEAVGSFRTRFDRSRARGLSAFVGRDRDMAVLDAALERANSGGGQVVGVVAEAGTGKSRLCAEFVEICRARGIPILEGRGVAHGKAIPMLPMLEMWRAFYEIGEGDDPETTRAKIAGPVLRMDESFREVLPFIFDLFGGPDPANPSPAIDAEQRQKRLHGVLKRVLHDPAYHGLRVILLEDLHWFDGASDAYLETTIESVPATRDLLLVTFRPEYRRAGCSARTTSSSCSSRSISRRSARSCAINSGRIRASRRCPRSSTRAPRAIRSSSRRSCSRWWRVAS